MMDYRVSLTTKVSASKLGKAAGRSLLAIEPEDYSRAEVIALKKAGYTVLGYLSAGSVSDERPYFDSLKKYRLKRLDDWPHEWYLDLRRSAVRDWCVKRAAEIKKQGFDGWWVDNLDVYEEYQSAAMYNAAVSTLRRIKSLGGYVMVNGGSLFLEKLMDSDGDASLYKVQIGAYRDKKNAERKRMEAGEKNITAAVVLSGGMYRVQAGAFSEKANAERRLGQVKEAGYRDAFILTEQLEDPRGYVNGVTQEEVFSLITDYAGRDVFGTQEKEQSAWYQEHLVRCVRNGFQAFLLEYTRNNTLKLRIRVFCSTKGMAGYCISENVNL